MSDTPSTAPQAGPEPEGQARGAAPAEVPLHDVVDPADVRRAPRYGRFLLVGAVLGALIGLGLGGYLIGTPDAAGMLKPGVYIAVVTAFTATLTTLGAGVLVLLADRRSVRRYESSRARR